MRGPRQESKEEVGREEEWKSGSGEERITHIICVQNRGREEERRGNMVSTPLAGTKGNSLVTSFNLFLNSSRGITALAIGLSE